MSMRQQSMNRLKKIIIIYSINIPDTIMPENNYFFPEILHKPVTKIKKKTIDLLLCKFQEKY